MEKLLTVSIAAYNVENYLEQALSSLNDSRFLDDVEVLIVDDGSKDGTKEIALRYQAMAPDTFRYVGKENGGHGSTINKGMELARGKYFRVLDGDDWVDTDGFAAYVEALKTSDTDLVLTQVRTVRGEEIDLRGGVEGMESGCVYTWNDGIDIDQATIHMVTVKTALLRGAHVHITEKCFYVDIEYTIWACYLAETVQFFRIPVYMYRVGTESQSTNKKNMLKNVAMQETVARNVAAMYERFTQEDSFTGLKKDVVFRRAAQSVGATVRTYLLLDSGKEARDKITAFESGIRERSPALYRRMNDQRFFQYLRWKNYALLPVIRVAYKLWCMR